MCVLARGTRNTYQVVRTRTNPIITESLNETLPARSRRVAPTEVGGWRAEPGHAASQYTRQYPTEASLGLICRECGKRTNPSPGRGSPTVMFPTRKSCTVAPANVTSSRTKNGVSWDEERVSLGTCHSDSISTSHGTK